MLTISADVFFEIVGLILIVGGVYVTLTNRLTRIEERMEERQKAMEKEQSSMLEKIDNMQETLTQILVNLEKKANR